MKKITASHKKTQKKTSRVIKVASKKDVNTLLKKGLKEYSKVISALAKR